ncbi:hypothetical protein VN0905_11650 [Helicobacter pylori]
MGVFLDNSIKNVVDELNVRYFLPDIQREYVWLKKADEKKIEQLFDSILRGYPIDSFLFWKLQKEDIAKSNEQDENKLNFQLYQFLTNYDERKPHNEKIYIEQISRDDLCIVFRWPTALNLALYWAQRQLLRKRGLETITPTLIKRSVCI